MSRYDLIRFKKKQLEATDSLVKFLQEKKIVPKSKKSTDDLRWYIGMIYGMAYDEGMLTYQREMNRAFKQIKHGNQIVFDALKKSKEGVYDIEQG